MPDGGLVLLHARGRVERVERAVHRGDEEHVVLRVEDGRRVELTLRVVLEARAAVPVEREDRSAARGDEHAVSPGIERHRCALAWNEVTLERTRERTREADADVGSGRQANALTPCEELRARLLERCTARQREHERRAERETLRALHCGAPPCC